MNRFDRQLWKRFVGLIQPYWYPVEQGGGRTFLGLLLLLLLFIFTTFFIIVSTVSLVCQRYFPQLYSSIAPGFAESVADIINSPAIYGVVFCFFTPILGFLYYKLPWRNHRRPWSLLAVLLLLLLSSIALEVISSYVGRDIITAFAKKDVKGTFRLLFLYGSVFAVTTPIVVFYRYLTKKLGVHWYGWLTNYFLNKYFHNRAYYKIGSNLDIDNPDQRISEEVESFVLSSVEILLGIFTQALNLIAFIGVLWSISKALVAVLLLYSMFGNVATVFLGKRLIGLNFTQSQRKADFRYGLVHVRTHAESIAFFRGGDRESSLVRQRLSALLQNFNLLIRCQRNLDFFTQGYNYFVLILPYLVVTPLFFSGKIELGAITQAGIAFNMVLSSLSMIVRQFESLSAFAAEIHRLSSFAEALEALKPGHRSESGVNQNAQTIDTVEDFHLALEDITLQTPNDERILVKNLSVSIEAGKGLLIVGSSGCGKSSLLRALAGLWKTGSGRVVRPNLEEMMFLPQRPYMILGSLRDQLLYPNRTGELTDEELYQVLEQVNLEDLPERVGGLDVELNWDEVLSLGEQQRIAFARLLLVCPRYAILDEATSALDLANEEALYQQLQETKTTFISVGHRSSLLNYHQRVLELLGDSSWRLTSTQEYCADASSFA